MRQSVETARVQVEQARADLARQRELWSQQLTTREALERAENEVHGRRVVAAGAREAGRRAQAARIEQERAGLESARYDLSKVRIESPIDGIVTRRNIQEGETAVIGTMNNAGTVLLTLADMSVIQAEVEVDETNIPQRLARTARPRSIIDALPDRTFVGTGHRDRQQPDSGGRGRRHRAQATNFKVVVVHRRRHSRRAPELHLHGRHHHRNAQRVVAVPIAAVAVRELVYDDANGQIVRDERKDRRRRPRGEGSVIEPVASAAELPAGQTRKETEGVFVIRDGRAEFVPIKMGIAGEQYFEVAVGPEARRPSDHRAFRSVRSMADGDAGQNRDDAGPGEQVGA